MSDEINKSGIPPLPKHTFGLRDFSDEVADGIRIEDMGNNVQPEFGKSETLGEFMKRHPKLVIVGETREEDFGVWNEDLRHEMMMNLSPLEVHDRFKALIAVRSEELASKCLRLSSKNEFGRDILAVPGKVTRNEEVFTIEVYADVLENGLFFMSGNKFISYEELSNTYGSGVGFFLDLEEDSRAKAVMGLILSDLKEDFIK